MTLRKRLRNINNFGKFRGKKNQKDFPIPTVEQLEELFLKQAYICGICGLRYGDLDWHLDHIRQLHTGGKHTITNLRFVHTSCNLSRPHYSWPPFRPKPHNSNAPKWVWGE